VNVLSKLRLTKLIEQKKGYVTTKEVTEEGIHREYLALLIEEGKLIRTGPGLYQVPNIWEDRLFNIQKKKKHLVFSHGTALFLHGLTDREPIEYSVTLPTGYNTTQIKNDQLKTYTIKKSLFDLGKTQLETSYGNMIIVYDLERTICDIIRSRNRLDKQLVNETLKNYVSDHRRDLVKLMSYAKDMHIDNILKTYMEILL